MRKLFNPFIIPKLSNLRERYLSLSDDVYIHELPVGAYICKRSKESKLYPVKVEYINETAKRVFLKCDGSLTAEDIIKKVCEEAGEKVSKEFLIGSLIFLATAIKKGHIISSKKKIHKPIRVGGSSGYYSPLQAVIELTYKCNFQCEHCYASSSPQRSEMLPYPKIVQMLDEMYSHGIILIEFTGGEPLLHPDFSRILRFALDRFELVAVLTNGYLINRDLADLMESYKEKLIVSVSLHSSTPDFHDNFCHMRGAFQRACNAIKMLADLGVRVRVSSVITPDNYKDVKNTIELAHRLGAILFTYSPVFELGRAKGKSWQLSPEQAEELNLQLKEAINQWGKFIQIAPEYMVEWMKEHGCGAGWRSFVISPIGDVRPCILMPEDMIKMGNLFHDRIEDIFKRPIVNRLHDLKPPQEEICGECEHLLFCKLCHFRAIKRYKEIKEKCNWATINQIDSVLFNRR